ncbi:MAG: hypothetical protein LBC48_00475, partial [Dysgonamonadaceae bacterium]|nr:hypothetical protein [Dysgonamonadaceae bacterium]
MKNDLTWQILKAMNTLYIKKKIPSTNVQSGMIKHLMDKKLIRYQCGNHNYFESLEGYNSYYEKNFLQDFQRYESFLHSIDSEADGRKMCTVEDIKTLMFIADQRDELRKSLTTLRTFSSAIFNYGGSKYLENHPGLDKMVRKILEIENFPSEDPKTLQWRFVIDCVNPVAVVLCENLDFLKTPDIARQNNIELWYVGGNNTANIHHISVEKLNKPLYYSCDWDYDGLKIYCRIKDILKSKSRNITLLYPSNLQRLPVDSPYHNSKWKHSSDFSELDKTYFTSKEINLINQLIKKNEWIEEESNNL